VSSQRVVSALLILGAVLVLPVARGVSARGSNVTQDQLSRRSGRQASEVAVRRTGRAPACATSSSRCAVRLHPVRASRRLCPFGKRRSRFVGITVRRSALAQGERRINGDLAALLIMLFPAPGGPLLLPLGPGKVLARSTVKLLIPRDSRGILAPSGIR
jgi:hypothetical protein